MNIFFFEFLIQLDSISPLLYLLKKNKVNVKYSSLYPIHDYKYNNLFKILKSNKIEYIKSFPSNYRKKIIFYLLKVLTYLPKKIGIRLEGFWFRVYRNFNFLSRKEFVNFCKKNDVRNLIIPYDLPTFKKKFFQECKREVNINIIEIEVGARTLKSDSDKFNLQYCDYFISSNNLINEGQNFKKKIKCLGALRYAKFWLKLLSKKKKNNKKKSSKKINVVIFLNQRILEQSEKAFFQIMRNKSINLFIGNKPKSVLPLRHTDYFYDKFTTSELIDIADIIISHSSSILIEAILKKKMIIYTSFANYENIYSTIKKSHFEEMKSVLKAKNSKDLNDFIKKVKNDEIRVDYTKDEYKKLNQLKGFKTDNKIKIAYLKFFRKLKNV